MKAFITQIPAAPAPITPPKPDSLTEWSVLSAIAFFVVKEAVGWFTKKEDYETKLVTDLIKNQQIWSERLNEKYETTLIVVRDSQLKMGDAIVRMEVTMSEMSKLQYRETRQHSLHLIEVRDQLNSMNSVLTELLRRSDKQLGMTPPRALLKP